MNGQNAELDPMRILDEKFYMELVESNLCESFSAHMRQRAELLARSIPGCQTDRQAAVASGMIAICYKLADDAIAAQSAYEAKAKVEEAERIRQEIIGKK